MTTETYDKKPKFDPNKPFTPVDEKPAFDPNKPFEEVDSKKKVGGEEPQYTFPTTVSEVLSTGRRKTQEDEKNKFIKPLPPQTFQQGVKKDKLEYSFQPQKKGSALGGVYNTVVDAVGKIFGGGAETIKLIQDTSDEIEGKKNEGWREVYDENGQLKTRPAAAPDKQLTREQVTNFIDKARSASSTRENEAARSQFDITNGLQKEDVEALIFQAPKTVLEMLAGAASGGTTFFLSSVNDNAKELEDSGAGKDLSASEKLGYVVAQGTVQAFLEKFGIDKVLKSTGLSSKIKQRLTAEITSELAKRGVKATTKDIEQLAFKKVSSLTSKMGRVGVKAVTSAVPEALTEAGQQVSSDLIKLGVNAIKDKKVFNEQDITANFIKNAINAGAMGGVFGGGVGGSVGVLSNTQKGLRSQIAQAQSPEDVTRIQQEINEQVELGNITEAEAQAANITAQQYAEIASKIPQEIDAEKKYALIGGIQQREDLKREIQNANDELGATDEAFHQPIQDRMELMNAKLEQTNDYIDGLVTGKKTTYKKQGDEYFKTNSEGESIPITQLHYELATAIREQDKINNQKPEISPTDQKTFTFDADEDVPTQLEKTQPIAIRETEDGKVEATYSGEQLIKAGLAAKPKELTEIQAAKILAKIPSLNDIDQAMADENPIGMVKFIAEQANGGRRKDMIEQGFPESVINEAVKAFPPTTEDVVPSLKDEGTVVYEGTKMDLAKELQSRNDERAIHANIYQNNGYVVDIFSNGKTIVNEKFKTHEEAKKFLNEWSTKNSESNKEKYDYGTIQDIANPPYRIDVFGQLPKEFQPKQQTKVSPTEQAGREVLDMPKNWDAVKDNEVEVPNADGSKTKMKFKRAFVDLKKQFKQLDNVLNCI